MSWAAHNVEAIDEVLYELMEEKGLMPEDAYFWEEAQKLQKSNPKLFDKLWDEAYRTAFDRMYGI